MKSSNTFDIQPGAGRSYLALKRSIRIMLAHAMLFTLSLFFSFLVVNDMEISPPAVDDAEATQQGAKGVEPAQPVEEDKESNANPWWFPKFFGTWLVVTLFVKLLIFGFLHQYQGFWRYVSVPDLLTIITGTFISSLILAGIWYFLWYVYAPSWFLELDINAIMDSANSEPFFDLRWFVGLEKDIYTPDKYTIMIPPHVMLLDWMISVVFVCGVRLAIRLYYEETGNKENIRLTRLLIVGAGNAGEVLIREIHRKPNVRYEVVGFIDDDVKKQGLRIHGIAVLGTTGHIKEIARQRNIDEIVISMPSATHKQLRRVIKLCEGANLRFSMVPDLVDIAAGKLNVSQIRHVDINDLLGRVPVKLDEELISRFINNKVVAITGAGGSIGSEMCRQVLQYGPKRLILIEQAENALFDISRELVSKFSPLDIQSCICDIIDRKRVEKLYQTYRPEVVIHAAAHKHVPLMELNPGEAIKNNVMGTRNMAEAADKFGTGHFVMISTDKAVNPTSIMGSSKRLAEMLIQCLNRRSKTDLVMVRFGNVLGSNGSVIPIFQKQIARGGPVTVTHPEMRRYFMTIPEAAQLVLQAATMGEGGEVFVLDMGEPVKIADLAKELITLSGFRVAEDIEIEYTGMRPGEKLFEELSMTGEDMQPTRHPKISIWKNQPPEESELSKAIEKLLTAADEGEREDIIKLIKEVVPEYVGDVDSMALHQEYQAKNNHSDVIDKKKTSSE